MYSSYSYSISSVDVDIAERIHASRRQQTTHAGSMVARHGDGVSLGVGLGLVAGVGAVQCVLGSRCGGLGLLQLHDTHAAVESMLQERDEVVDGKLVQQRQHDESLVSAALLVVVDVQRGRY